MKRLNTILKDVQKLRISGDINRDISKLCIDSRMVVKDALFIAIEGSHSDGHDYIDQAIQKGASCIVVEKSIEKDYEKICVIQVRSSTYALGIMASNWYNQPSEKLKLIGVTGTNGKTTVCTLLFDFYKNLGQKVGLISTIENRLNDEIISTQFTTPLAPELNSLLDKMVRSGCDKVFMEVSSHAIAQNRIAGLDFDGAVFTNITHDHLEYHNSFRDYIKTKKKFFDQLKKNAFALTNVDDKNGEVMVQNTKAKIHRYALTKLVDYKAKLLNSDLEGIQLNINGVEIHSRLVGRFNAYNLLAVYGVMDLLDGVNLENLTVLSDLGPAKGRFEIIRGSKKSITAIVDYAHTPDALDNVLKTIKESDRKGQLITVIGCGGDRDHLKRPKMGRVAATWSDEVILTSDNPRSEDPDKIIDEMYEGLNAKEKEKTIKVTKRKEAIKLAVRLAEEKAIVLVAGKGHEKYQEIKGKKIPFDDIDILKALLLEDIKE